MARLSALGFLQLAAQKRVARVNLAEAGYEGEVFVCDLSATQMQSLTAPRGQKARIYKDQSMDVDMSALAPDAAAKWLMACLVTDTKGGEVLERAFEALGEGEEPHIVIDKEELVWLADEWRKEARNEAELKKRLDEVPSGVTELIVRTVKRISGVGADAVEEKKEN